MVGFIKAQAKIEAAHGKLYDKKFSREVNERGIKMILNDEVIYEADEKHAHAKNIVTLDKLPISLAVGDWKVLFNDEKNFLTSDNPLCIYRPRDNINVAWLYAPLMLDMALLIRTNPESHDHVKNKDFSKINIAPIEWGNVTFDGKRRFNRNLVRHAEEKVFFSERKDWIERLVMRNRGWIAESVVDTLPSDNGYLHIIRDRTRKV